MFSVPSRVLTASRSQRFSDACFCSFDSGLNESGLERFSHRGKWRFDLVRCPNFRHFAANEACQPSHKGIETGFQQSFHRNCSLPIQVVKSFWKISISWYNYREHNAASPYSRTGVMETVEYFSDFLRKTGTPNILAMGIVIVVLWLLISGFVRGLRKRGRDRDSADGTDED